MSAIIELARARRERAAQHRERLMAFARAIALPKTRRHPRSGQLQLSAANVEQFEAVFALFGVRLDFGRATEELLLSTWYELGCVARALEMRERLGEAPYRRLCSMWDEGYVAFLEALWAGEPARIRECAARLGIEAGVPRREKLLRHWSAARPAQTP